MRNYSIILVVFLLFMNSPAHALVEIIGDGNKENGIEDNRISLSFLPTPILTQIRSVGVFRCGQEAIGSGIIVRSDQNNALILTAKHVLSGKDLSTCQFYPYDMYQGYKFVHLRDDKALVSNKGLQNNASSEAASLAQMNYQDDWAVAHVKADLTAYGQVSFIKEKKPIPRKVDILFIGYDQIATSLIASQDACDTLVKVKDGLAADQPSVGLDRCDSNKGASGGALFVITSKGQLKLLGMRTGFLYAADLLSDKKPHRGDIADVRLFANAHHMISKPMRSFIKTQWGIISDGS